MNHVSLSHRRGVIALVCAFVLIVATVAMAGCSSSQSQANSQSSTTQTAAKSLDGKTLKIYCGAGMTEPFQKIADAFTEQTGCKMDVTFANAAQIQTQINTTKEGDFFIAGSADELEPVKGYVASSTDLVKHIPVLAVPKDNPKNIQSLADLPNADKILIGDPESTPIGKIAKNLLTKKGLWDSLSASNKLTTTTTAPQIATALANHQGDAGIVWKENAQSDGVAIVATSDLDGAIKTVPAAMLSCSKDTDTAKAFNDFLQTDTAKNIWTSAGYELV